MYTVSNSHISMFISIVKTIFEWYSMLQGRGNQILKGATIKGKNMLPMRIEKKIKGHYIKKSLKLDYTNMSVF